MTIVDELRVTFPWLEQAGLVGSVTQWVRDGLSSATELVARIRASGEYKAMFPAIRREDGTLRMTEAQYMQQQDAYREVFRQYGDASYDYDSPADFTYLFENDIGTQEISQRFEVFDALRSGPNEIRTAFYVYGGINLSDEDLYSYIVDPSTRPSWDSQYNQAAGNVDYATFVQRTAEMAIDGATRTVEALERAGSGRPQPGGRGVTSTTIRNVNLDTATQVVDLLYHGGAPDGGDYLALNDLMHAFEAALIGSAASSQGLELPDIARVEEFRSAGVTRAQALQTYGQYAQQKDYLRGVVERARGTEFGQVEFENSQLLSESSASLELQQGMAAEAAKGQSSGAASFNQTAQGGVVQTGLRRK